MNNIVKELPCYYASTQIRKKEGSVECSKFAKQIFFDENVDRTFPLCDKHYMS